MFYGSLTHKPRNPSGGLEALEILPVLILNTVLYFSIPATIYNHMPLKMKLI